MPVPAQQNQAVALSFLNILKRLRTVLPASANYVRGVIAPNPEQAEYKAEEGVHVAIGSPEPSPTSGAGRWGLLVDRPVMVYVTTRCLLDPSPRDEIALTAHVTLEESVVNAVLDGHPNGPSIEGIRLTWVPGGSAPSRRVKHDVGLMTSMLVFNLHYAMKLTPGPGPAV